VRLTPGDDPTHTALAEFYEVPAPGGDDADGMFWISRRAAISAVLTGASARVR
jgi:hypothetical protein